MILRKIYYWLELKRHQYKKPLELKKIQEKRLRAIIKHAYENVPFYKELFDKHEVKPTDIKTVRDLRRLPIITKKDNAILALRSLEKNIATAIPEIDIMLTTISNPIS